MGRVARYKKVKKSLSKATPKGAERISINNNGKDSKGSIDYFDRVGVWGLGDSGRKPKKRSLASMKLRAQRNKKIPDTREAYDLVCAEGDDFDLNDLVGSLKKEQQPTEITAFTTTSLTTSAVTLPKDSEQTSTAAMSAASQTLEVPANSHTATSSKELIAADDEKLHKKFEAQVVPNKSTIVKSEGRMVGESKNAYSKRVRQETRQIIQRANQQAHNPEKRLKKKEFLTLKKKNGTSKKRKNKFIGDNDDDAIEMNDDDYNNESDKLLTGEQAVAARERATRVQFGEQAERPPNFTQLPRGANKIAQKKQKFMLSSSTMTSIKTQQDIDAEALAMDRIRRKVQAQYAEIKARRRNNGDFHL
jgi:hypothetical protein